MTKPPKHDIHMWQPVPLEVAIYACSDCGVRGRRVGRRVIAYKQQRRTERQATVGFSSAPLDPVAATLHDYSGA